MVDKNNPIPSKPIAKKVWMGQDLNWDASQIEVALWCELQFWIMVPNCSLEVEVNGHKFTVDIDDSLIEKYAGIISGSKSSFVYIGPPNRASSQIGPKTKKYFKRNKIPVVDRKCKTVLLIHSSCNEDIVRAAYKSSKRSEAIQFYLNAFCEAHIQVVNQIIQSYRLSTYDYFAHEISPWDIPVWFLVSDTYGPIKIDMLMYACWDMKPNVSDEYGSSSQYTLIDPSQLQSALNLKPSAGEYELLDALNLMEQGDYSGAVRRITTAIEAQLESVLQKELCKNYPPDEVTEKLKKSQNDFPGRLRQYLKLSGRIFPDVHLKELNTTRDLRHSIVHQAKRISFHDRGIAQRSVDTGRWIFNWFEDNSTRRDLREKRIGLRSLGKHFKLYDAEIISTGVIVHKPHI